MLPYRSYQNSLWGPGDLYYWHNSLTDSGDPHSKFISYIMLNPIGLWDYIPTINLSNKSGRGLWKCHLSSFFQIELMHFFLISNVSTVFDIYAVELKLKNSKCKTLSFFLHNNLHNIIILIPKKYGFNFVKVLDSNYEMHLVSFYKTFYLNFIFVF